MNGSSFRIGYPASYFPAEYFDACHSIRSLKQWYRCFALTYRLASFDLFPLLTFIENMNVLMNLECF